MPTISPTVLVAAISGIASVAAAVFSLVQARRTAHLNAQATLLLEKFKAEEDKRRRAFELATNESEPLVAACRQVWGDIQVVRNVIGKALAPGRYSLQSALLEIQPAVSSISTVYNEWGATLPEIAQRGLHTAKNSVALVEPLLHDRATASGTEQRSTHEVDRRLAEIRESLRDTQTIIHEALWKIRAEQMNRILEAM